MSKTLTQLVSAVQAQLIDDGTRFTTATCTAAIRAALSKLNHRLPISQADLITIETDTKEYEISDIDSRAQSVLDVLIYDDENAEDHQPIKYDAYFEDERLFIRTRNYESTSEQLLVRYTIFHTINGLDSATESTLSTDQDQIITDGACAEALQFRAISRTETINLQQDVGDNYRDAIKWFTDAFNLGIRAYEMRRSPVSEPRNDAWDDI